MVKVGFDIGGVLSKYPEIFQRFILDYFINKDYPDAVYVITDQHDREEVWQTLQDNGFDFIFKENIHCADYNKYGDMCKAVLIKELQLDIFIDDHQNYLKWDSTFGRQPILLHLQGDPYLPYWADSWKVTGDSTFGRRVYTPEPEK